MNRLNHLRTRLQQHPIYWAAPFVLLALLLVLAPVSAETTGAVRAITLDLTQFEFAPGRLEVNQGDRVVITLKATDVVHGFYVDGYGIETRVEPGTPQQVEFVADQSGKFRYRCSVSCGPLHPFMIGELIVGSNAPFWKSVGVAAIAIAGMFVFLWRLNVTNEQKTF